jgi:hypothetical protein
VEDGPAYTRDQEGTVFKRFKGLTWFKPATSAQLNVEPFVSEALAIGKVTRALLLMAARHNAQSREWWDAQGNEWPALDQNTLEGQIDSALSVVALAIVDDAMQEALGAKEFLDVKASMPGDPLPPYVHLLVAFSFAVVAGIALQLRTEGSRSNIDSQKPCIGVIDALFLLRSNEEKAKIFMMGSKAFTTVTRSGAQNVIEWFNNLKDLIILYLLEQHPIEWNHSIG